MAKEWPKDSKQNTHISRRRKKRSSIQIRLQLSTLAHINIQYSICDSAVEDENSRLRLVAQRDNDVLRLASWLLSANLGSDDDDDDTGKGVRRSGITSANVSDVLTATGQFHLL